MNEVAKEAIEAAAKTFQFGDRIFEGDRLLAKDAVEAAYPAIRSQVLAEVGETMGESIHVLASTIGRARVAAEPGPISADLDAAAEAVGRLRNLPATLTEENNPPSVPEEKASESGGGERRWEIWRVDRGEGAEVLVGVTGPPTNPPKDCGLLGTDWMQAATVEVVDARSYSELAEDQARTEREAEAAEGLLDDVRDLLRDEECSAEEILDRVEAELDRGTASLPDEGGSEAEGEAGIGARFRNFEKAVRTLLESGQVVDALAEADACKELYAHWHDFPGRAARERQRYAQLAKKPGVQESWERAARERITVILDAAFASSESEHPDERED